MRLCQNILAAALCVLVLLPEPGCARSLWKRALLKMTEKYDVSKAEGIFGDARREMGSFPCAFWDRECPARRAGSV